MGWNYCKTCRGNGDVRKPGSRWWWPVHIICPDCDGNRYAKPGPRPDPPPAPPPVASVAVVDIRPGDRLVFTTPGVLSEDAREAIRQEVKRWAPDCKCLLLEDGVQITVVRDTETP